MVEDEPLINYLWRCCCYNAVVLLLPRILEALVSLIVETRFGLLNIKSTVLDTRISASSLPIQGRS